MQAQADGHCQDDDHGVLGVEHGESEERPGGTGDGAHQVHGLPPPAVHEPSHLRDDQEVDEVGDQQCQQERGRVVFVDALEVHDREADHEVVHDVFREPEAHGLQDALGVLADDLADAEADGLLLLQPGFRFEEDGRLGDVGADVIAHEHDHRGEPERHAPAPAEEVGAAEDVGHDEQDQGGQQVAYGNGGLGPAGPESAGLVGAVLGDEQHGAAPFAAQCEALDEAQEHQECRGEVTDLGEAGEAAHQERRHTDDHDGELKGRLAAQLVADLAEDDAAERAGHEADRVGDEGLDDAVQLIAGGREEVLSEHQGCCSGVEEEFVPFHYGANHGGCDDFLEAGAL
ncbi:hypothetical protein D9M72_460000 [compost metagenome]